MSIIVHDASRRYAADEDAVWSALLDFVLSAIPWFYVSQLHMSRRDKLGIASAMSLGVVAGGCGIGKIAELKNLSSRTDYACTYHNDLTCTASTAIVFLTPTLQTIRLVSYYGPAQNRHS